MISLLYICTFGSWIGFAFAFGQGLQVNFLANGEAAKHAALHAAQIAFVGPLLGSLARIYGGRLADRLGGGRVTLGVLGGMILAAGRNLDRHQHLSTTTTRRGRYQGAPPAHDRLRRQLQRAVPAVRDGQWRLVFKLIPSVFEARSRSLDVSEAERRHWSRAHDRDR